MCQGGFLKKNEDEGWLLYEDLADKTIQWEPTPKKLGLMTLALLKWCPFY